MNPAIKEATENHVDPYTSKTWGEMKVLRSIAQHETEVTIFLELSYPVFSPQLLTDPIKEKLLAFPDVKTVTINLSSNIASHAIRAGLKALPEVKNIIAIASGKGGVGKSTTALNIAAALSAQGAHVGILDADIYGPNQPHMLGQSGQIQVENGKALPPVLAHGMQSMSMGYLIAPETPMIWRGPMVSSALQQLAHDTAWQGLDYLIIDLPPGTGDIQLTLSQKIPVTAAIILTTPQDIALLDARKGLEMFKKVNVPVLGVIENMSQYVCSHCGHAEAVFGEAGAAHLAEGCDVPLLGQLPLSKRIREQADSGKPIVLADAHSDIAQKYHEIATKIAALLSLCPKNHASIFPDIVVQNNE